MLSEQEKLAKYNKIAKRNNFCVRRFTVEVLIFSSLRLWDLSFSPMSVLTLVKRRPLEYSNVDILFTLTKIQ
jgi:hypothetical protein